VTPTRTAICPSCRRPTPALALALYCPRCGAPIPCVPSHSTGEVMCSRPTSGDQITAAYLPAEYLRAGERVLAEKAAIRAERVTPMEVRHVTEGVPVDLPRAGNRREAWWRRLMRAAKKA
jgi:hypothetical protein